MMETQKEWMDLGESGNLSEVCAELRTDLGHL